MVWIATVCDWVVRVDDQRAMRELGGSHLDVLANVRTVRSQLRVGIPGPVDGQRHSLFGGGALLVAWHAVIRDAVGVFPFLLLCVESSPASDVLSECDLLRCQ